MRPKVSSYLAKSCRHFRLSYVSHGEHFITNLFDGFELKFWRVRVQRDADVRRQGEGRRRTAQGAGPHMGDGGGPAESGRETQPGSQKSGAASSGECIGGVL